MHVGSEGIMPRILYVLVKGSREWRRYRKSKKDHRRRVHQQKLIRRIRQTFTIWTLRRKKFLPRTNSIMGRNTHQGVMCRWRTSTTNTRIMMTAKCCTLYD